MSKTKAQKTKDVYLRGLPLYMENTRGKKWWLNLNVFRNTHPRALAGWKTKYALVVSNLVRAQSVPVVGSGPFLFEFTYYGWRNARMDIENPCAIISKFTNDALVQCGIIPDDDVKVVPAITHLFGGLDRDNPRVDLRITPYLG